MVITLNSPINTLNKSYANKTSFKKAPTYQNFAEIVRHGSLKEIQNISWIHGCDEQGRNLLQAAASTAQTEVIIQKSIDNAITRKEAVSENDLIKQIQKFKPALTEEIVEEYRNKI